MIQPIMNKKFSIFVISIIAFILGACTDDSLYLENESGSTVKDNGHCRITSFEMPHHWKEINSDFNEVDITLISLNSEYKETFKSLVRLHNKKISVNIEIPADKKIHDGTYVMRGAIRKKHFEARVVVEFKDEMMKSVRLLGSYNGFSNGDGSEATPYIIASDSDFSTFLNNLSQDTETSGAGYYFKQTANISIQQQSLIGNRGFVGKDFAGHYDGGNFTISDLYYSGSFNTDTDTEIGLFKTLKNGASIKCLTVKATSISGVASKGGILAGKATGTVTIDSVTVAGAISLNNVGNDIGGIIGYAKDATISITNCHLQIGINYGDEAIGGVIGNAHDSNLNISNIYSSKSQFNISGSYFVGGIVGYLYSSSFNISNITLENISDTDNSDLTQISSTTSPGGDIGGIAGRITYAKPNSEISNAIVRCPIGAASDDAKTYRVGGIVGSYLCDGQTLTLNKCQASGFVRGYTDIGGLIGHCDYTPILVIGDKCAVEVQKTAAVGISGTENVGGLIGYMKSTNISFTGESRMSANISGTKNVGGAVGYIEKTTVDVANIKIDAEIDINGSENTGGLIGYSYDATIISDNKFDYNESGSDKIPLQSKFSPDFAGEVFGGIYTGGAVGYAKNSNVSFIHIAAHVEGSENNVGGVIGFIDNSDCSDHIHYQDLTFASIVTGHKENNAGIAGKLQGKGYMQDCVNYGEINGYGNSTGGIVGYIYKPEHSTPLYYCVNIGKVSGKALTGGVVGEMGSVGAWKQINSCANYGEVLGTNDGLGGILGGARSKGIEICHCANHGKISGSGSFKGIGGIAGHMGEDADVFKQEKNLKIHECSNFGTLANITSKDAYIGGILGYQEEGAIIEASSQSHVYDCYNRGDITTPQDHCNGGIVSYVDYYAVVSRCVNLGMMPDDKDEACVGDHKAEWYDHNLYYLDGTGGGWKATAISKNDIGNQSKYSGFDFTNTWMISGGYPALRNCPFQFLKP